ncbi:hypothetical protein G9C85_12595 [Halorubellus sp. JP-L1]|uniref:hypothetical protein n=1 Tax=Halorubellus sp. JP-L1 TaxID=2715753 RepID=UPI00140B63B2|nr:hypothetical protein [Halorubellus sp. JP-L1]NHN42457.1 hypothetical protein [Halorubellus sp. JP-L1]
MRSTHHFVLSVLVGAATVPFVDAPVRPVVVVAYVAVLGVGIDLDHFALAWYNSGSLRALRGCLADPRRVFVAQDEIFEPGEVWPLERLLSHAVLGGVLVGGLLAVDAVALAVVSGVVLYVHVLADLAWDVLHQERYFENVRAAT